MTEVFKITLTALLPVLVTVFFSLLEKKTGFKQLRRSYKQIIIGVFFGITAVLGTELGINIGGAVINIRDASPVCAAFFFGPAAGVISAFIGGIERLFAVMWGAGEFTALACSLSTILAGCSAALLQKYMNENQRPSILYTLVFCIVMESIHMLIIFLTNITDIERAYLVVQSCYLIMIAVNTASVMLSLLFTSLIRKEKHSIRKPLNEISVSKMIENWIILIVTAAFAFTGVVSYIIQSKLAIGQTESTLLLNLDSFQQTLKKNADEKINNVLWSMAYSDNNESTVPLFFVDESSFDDINGNTIIDDEDITAFLNNYCVRYDIEEVNIVSDDAKIVYSSNTEKLGKKVSEDFTQNVSDDSIFIDNCIYDNETTGYAGITISDNTYFYPKGKYLQIAYSYQYIEDILLRYITSIDNNYQINKSSRIAAYFNNPTVDNTYTPVAFNYPGSNDEIDEKYREIDYLNPETQKPLTLNTIEADGKKCFMMYDSLLNLYFLAEADFDAAMLNRNISVFIMIFMEMPAFALLFIILNLLLRKKVVKSIENVNEKLDTIRQGNLDVTVDVYTSSEFSSLSNDINSTVTTLKGYIAREASRIDNELEHARQIQESALPRIFPPFPNRKEFDIYASMTPAKEVGGDFYDFFFAGNNQLAFLVADVSGKGIPSALFMMNAKALIKDLAEQGNSLADVFNTANQRISETNDAGMFVTVWMGIIDLENGEVEYVNAGHNPPLVKRGGQFEYLRGRTGFVLSGMKRAKYTSKKFKLSHGDEILLYTDGVTEACDINGGFYGEERLINFVNGNTLSGPEELCEKVKRNVDEFSADIPQSDDITVLSIKYYGVKSHVIFAKTFDAAIENTPTVIEFVSDCLKKENCSQKLISRFSLVVDEIFSNIAKYAYKNALGSAEVSVEIHSDRIVLVFSDKGFPFNPILHQNPEIESKEASQRTIGGLGIHIVKKLMDNTEYERVNGKNILRITKKKD